MTVECEHGETMPEICPACQRAPRLLVDDGWSHPFVALYRGTCDGCGGPIEPGDRIRGYRLENAYRHEECT